MWGRGSLDYQFPPYILYVLFLFVPTINPTREGFNAILKKCAKLNMSMLHFVEQHQKIQDKCFISQDG
jgi:hypothetical protein